MQELSSRKTQKISRGILLFVLESRNLGIFLSFAEDIEGPAHTFQHGETFFPKADSRRDGAVNPMAWKLWAIVKAGNRFGFRSRRQTLLRRFSTARFRVKTRLLNIDRDRD